MRKIKNKTDERINSILGKIESVEITDKLTDIIYGVREEFGIRRSGVSKYEGILVEQGYTVGFNLEKLKTAVKLEEENQQFKIETPFSELDNKKGEVLDSIAYRAIVSMIELDNEIDPLISCIEETRTVAYGKSQDGPISDFESLIFNTALELGKRENKKA